SAARTRLGGQLQAYRDRRCAGLGRLRDNGQQASAAHRTWLTGCTLEPGRQVRFLPTCPEHGAETAVKPDSYRFSTNQDTESVIICILLQGFKEALHDDENHCTRHAKNATANTRLGQYRSLPANGCGYSGTGRGRGAVIGAAPARRAGHRGSTEADSVQSALRGPRGPRLLRLRPAAG